MKRIGVLTSGGDAPGMNAALRAVTRMAINNGLEVMGIRKGYFGLVNDDMSILSRRDVSDIVQRGGTKLKTARCKEFQQIEGIKKAHEVIKARKIDAIVAIGGDGTFRGCKDLYDHTQIPCVGIPATIDNDLAYTDYTIGFDTAANTIVHAINNLRDTMISHDRVCIVEVMGRKCGDLALNAGIAGGAEIILVPEKRMSLSTIIRNIKDNVAAGKSSEIILLAEGFCKAETLKDEIIRELGMTVWTSRLGHIQRGGTPTVQDRILAARLGCAAVDVLLKGKTNHLVGIKNHRVVTKKISEALEAKAKFNKKLYKEAKIISL